MKEKNFNVLIVDDEPEARRLLKSLLSDIPRVSVIGESDNAENALYKIVKHYPNLVFMDINMPGKTGMQLVRLMRKSNVDVPVVFISGFEEYALDSLRNEVYDFLLKPVDRIELKNIIDKHRRRQKKDLPSKLMEVLDSIKDESKIKINSRYSYILVNPSEIAYCVAEYGYTSIHLTNGKEEIANTSLTQIEQKVVQHNFFRLGRSLLVNLDYIFAVNKTDNEVELRFEDKNWKINASRKSIKKMLKTCFNYA